MSSENLKRRLLNFKKSTDTERLKPGKTIDKRYEEGNVKKWTPDTHEINSGETYLSPTAYGYKPSDILTPDNHITQEQLDWQKNHPHTTDSYVKRIDAYRELSSVSHATAEKFIGDKYLAERAKQALEEIEDRPSSGHFDVVGESNWFVKELLDSDTPIPLSGDFVTFIGGSDFTTLTLASGSAMDISDDGINFTSWDNTAHTVIGGVCYVRGKSGLAPVYGFSGNFLIVKGNAADLINYEWRSSGTIPPTLNSSQFSAGDSGSDKGLFTDCIKLVNTSEFELPWASIPSLAYCRMFYGCTALESAPDLSGITTLTHGSCTKMFMNCSKLTASFDLSNVESVPAITELTSPGCMQDMFRGCSLLTTVQGLSKLTRLSYYCCQDMFSDCSKLTTIPTLSNVTEISAASCGNMFKNCSSLKKSTWFSSSLNTLYNESCYGMFEGCIAMWLAPNMYNITTLSGNTDHPSMGRMFYNCKALAGPVYLPNVDPADSGDLTKDNVTNMFYEAGTNRDYRPSGFSHMYAKINYDKWLDGRNITNMDNSYWSIHQG